MCVYSMVVDRYYDKWREPPYSAPPFIPFPYTPYVPSQLTEEEIKEFREWLRRAKKYDEENGQKKCENKEKINRLKALAKELGVDLLFPEGLDEEEEKS